MAVMDGLCFQFQCKEMQAGLVCVACALHHIASIAWNSFWMGMDGWSVGHFKENVLILW